MSFFSELKRRRVVRVAAMYGVTAWILTEVSSVVMPALFLPEWTLTFVVVVLILGFPIALILAWVFDIGPGGIERTASAAGPGRPGRAVLIGYAVLLVAATAVLSSVLYFRGVTAGPAASRTSIAVLPFANLSEGQDKDYFSDGMSEELLNLLANVPGLNVAARTSSFAYRGKDVDVRQVGRELGVETVLEGSVRWAGEERVRITAQLIDTSTGYHIWSENYDRSLEDIFAVQDEIARQIVNKLKLHLGATLLSVGTQDEEAYDLYLRGRHVWKRRGAEAVRRSIELFQAAVGRDPGYAQAHAALAASYVLLPEYAGESADMAFGLATASARQALALDANLADAHAVLALIATERAHWLDAEAGFFFATSLGPNEPTPHQWYSSLLGRAGRLDAALVEARRAYELDPTSPILASTLADLHSVIGNDELALRYVAEARDLGLSTALSGTEGSVLLRLGRIDEARKALYLAAEEMGVTREDIDVFILRWQRSRSGDPLPPTDAPLDPDLPWQVAFNLALMAGQLDTAYRLLEQQDLSQGTSVTSAFWVPEATAFRRDPRFVALAGRLGLVEYWKQYGWPALCAPAGESFSCH